MFHHSNVIILKLLVKFILVSKEDILVLVKKGKNWQIIGAPYEKGSKKMYLIKLRP